MTSNQSSFSWRLEAVAKDEGVSLTEAALSGFQQAADRMNRPGAFEGCAIVVESRTFAELTGFHPHGGEQIDAGVVKRAADAATPARARALANCSGSGSADYVSLGLFLDVCATNGLALRTERPIARNRVV